MKREERKVYNNLKKTVTPDTLYVEIPIDWTHEARQAIHELLTVEKGMIATVIGPDCCTFRETIRYTHSSEATKATRQAQEVNDIDEIMKELRHTDYTWNGYKANEEEHATEEPAQTESKKEEKTMTEYTGRKIGNNYSVYGESILVNGCGITIDRTHYATEWNERHGMKPEYMVTTQDNERFTVWTQYVNGSLNLANAIPA